MPRFWRSLCARPSTFSTWFTTPSLALDRARLEILHQDDRVKEMFSAILPAVLEGTAEDLEAIREMDDTVDTIHGHIVTSLGRVSQEQLTTEQTAASREAGLPIEFDGD